MLGAALENIAKDDYDLADSVEDEEAGKPAAMSQYVSMLAALEARQCVMSA